MYGVCKVLQVHASQSNLNYVNQNQSDKKMPETKSAADVLKKAKDSLEPVPARSSGPTVAPKNALVVREY
jgi:hypothetical protein